MTLLDGLNAEQRAAVEHLSGPLLIAAVAGCGKTTVLVRRMVRLIEAGADPARILAVTFSVKAAKEMTDRLAKLGCSDARVGTFHSLALQIIRAEFDYIGNWKIDDSDRYRICVKDAISFREMNWGAADVTYLTKYITLCKAYGALPADDKALDIARQWYKRQPGPARDPIHVVTAYEVAERIRRERYLLTFDDMPLLAWKCLGTDEGARFRWAAHWDYVLQDECQDENLVQHELAAMLSRDHKNYCIVGDVAQSIYMFRGAEPSNMLKFEREWDSRVIHMNRNYRSARAIVEIANRSLCHMPADTHLGVMMVGDREAPGMVRASAYSDFDVEGEGVTEQILVSHEDGVPWKDHVVLYRTNAQSRGVEEQLLGARVPYVVLGGTNFYERREVKCLLAYLRVAAGIATFDDIKRSLNAPFRFLGKAFLDGLESSLDGISGPFMLEAIRQHVASSGRLQQRQRTSAQEYCQAVDYAGAAMRMGIASATEARDTLDELDARPSRLLELLVGRLKYTEWLTRDEGTESPENNRVSNVRELIRAADRFPTTDELLEYVDDTIARAAKAKKEFTSSDVVTLCSIHRAKGLEWPVVFVIGCNEKILPHAKAEDLNEERRLFYVACTRARDVLELSYVQQAAVGRTVLQLAPSMFLEEVGVLSPKQVAPEAV